MGEDHGESGNLNFEGDFIADFASGTDIIQLDGAAFGFSFTGALTLNSTFFIEADFDGTSLSGGTPTDTAFLVFAPNSSTLFADETLNDGGYTVVADLSSAPAVADFELI